jgi:hypothetical protein
VQWRFRSVDWPFASEQERIEEVATAVGANLNFQIDPRVCFKTMLAVWEVAMGEMITCSAFPKPHGSHDLRCIDIAVSIDFIFHVVESRQR